MPTVTPDRNQSQSGRHEKFREIQNKAKTLSDDIAELLDLYYKLGVVTVTEKASNAASVSITFTIIISLTMFSLLFAGLGVGWYLGERLNNVMAGYCVVAGIFLLLIILTLLLRKSYIFPYIRNTIIKKIYES
jgi:hypothetical protein